MNNKSNDLISLGGFWITLTVLLLFLVQQLATVGHLG
jgi:hypothetical protein